MDVGSEQVGPRTFCNSCSSFYLSQTYKPSLQKLDPRGRPAVTVLTSQPPKYGQIHPQRASSTGARPIYGWELWNEALQVKLELLHGGCGTVKSGQGTYRVSQEASFHTTCQLSEVLVYLSTVRKLCSVWNNNNRISQMLKGQSCPYFSVSL